MNDIDEPDRPDEDATVDDDEIIDLSDPIAPDDGESTGGDPAEEDEILELVDAVDAAQIDDDEIIDLVDAATAEPEVTEAPLEEMDAEELIDSIIEETLELEEILDEESTQIPEEIDEFVEDLGMDLDEDLEPVEESEEALGEEAEDSSDPVAVTSEQVETAVARVVAEVYSDRIEDLLVSAVEEKVKSEIERLQAIIDDAADGIEG